jgi:hypothetical protein
VLPAPQLLLLPLLLLLLWPCATAEHREEANTKAEMASQGAADTSLRTAVRQIMLSGRQSTAEQQYCIPCVIRVFQALLHILYQGFE